MENRPPKTWLCGDHALELGPRTRVMGILNVTPDSFSDGGEYTHIDAALDHADGMLADGADILDVGGESTRPGADPVPLLEELNRTIPVIERLAAAHPRARISIDTSKAAVAEAALDAGACIVNDVSAASLDPAMPALLARRQPGVVLMHMPGSPRNMQDQPHYADVVSEVASHLRQRADQLDLPPDHIVLDPGIGFGKTLAHNLAILRDLPRFASLGFPLLIGLSRKRFLGDLTERPVHQRLAGSLAGLAAAVHGGAAIMRVHDVRQSVDAVRVLDAVREGAA